ncbi:MAG: PspC domain-containing protein [Bacteroidia bacterium]|nr:PspC domain-containing protein [Bacteroidia bacterium]
MKKNISINISGIIFHIEEDGYEKLRKYLDSVNKYFGAFEDSSEILADIEGRIAEIFLSKLSEGKQVITQEDVTFLVATMGSVSDFKAAEDQENPAGESFKQEQSQKTGAYSSSGNPAANKKLFRDQKRKIVGGVCAGLGHYFNIDPVWPRLLFALLVLGSYGGLILVYIIFWIVLPPSSELEEEPTVKKMFRDTSEKKVLGGVASGVAAFFGADTSVIRLLFVIFAFIGGLGFIVYIVLWIALPEAKTITEKMQMQGEAVTLSNIESSVKKGLNEKDEAEESTLAKIILFPFRTLAAIITALAKVLGPLFKVGVDILRIAIGIAILLLGMAFVFSLLLVAGIFIGLISVGSFPLWGDLPINGLSLPLDAMRNAFPTWTVLFAFLAAFIPAMFILLIGGSIVSKKLAFNPLVGWTMFVTFFISVAVLSFSIPRFIYAFKEDGEYKTEKVFDLAGKTPVLKINEVGLDDYDVTSLQLKGYNGKEIKLVQRFEAQGATRKLAGENAQTVTYAVMQTDSIITFDSNIIFNDGAKFHAQRLDVDILIPYNQPFVIDSELWRLIDTNVIRGHSRNYRSLNFETQTWQMTERGCECLSCQNEEEEISFDNGTPISVDVDAQDQYGLKDFDGVDLNGIFKASIIKGDSYSVRIKGNKSTRNHYNVYLDGETLVVDYDDDRKFFWKDNVLNEENLMITIVTPSLIELNVRGAGKVNVRGFDEEEMEINFLGAVEGIGEFSARNLDIKLTGASSLELKGEGNFMEANITGASGLRAYGFEVDRAVVEAHGASSAKVNATETLEITKGVASSVSHRGNPEITRRN